MIDEIDDPPMTYLDGDGIARVPAEFRRITCRGDRITALVRSLFCDARRRVCLARPR